MTTTVQLSRGQRDVLADLLRGRLLSLERQRESQLQDQSQVKSARRTLLQDADDATQRAGEHAVEDVVGDIDSAEFTAVSDALQRIHRDDYGVCANCHKTIPFDRLQIEPQAVRCVACQTLHERSRPPASSTWSSTGR